MNLSDFLGNGWDDPRSGQILGLAQGLLSARGGAGLAAGIEGMQRARQQDLRSQLARLQIRGAEREEADAALARAATQQRARAQSEFLNGLPSPQPSFAPGPAGAGGEPMAAPGGMPQTTQTGAPNPQAIYLRARQAGYSDAEAKAFATMQDIGRPKVARTVEGRDERGRPVTYQIDEFGGRIGSGIEQWKAPVQVNQGDRTTFLDPATMQDVRTLQQFQSPDSKASNAVAMRGQNMADARARATADQGKLHYDAERGGVVDLRTGTFTPATQDGAPVGAKPKPLNESQAKSLLFSGRMREAEGVISELAGRGVNTSIPGSRAGFGVGDVVTALSSSDRQRLDQAKRNWINANLRLESGAVIADSEYDGAEKQYFPQIGDSAEVIAQKARNRATAEAGIRANVPGAPQSGGASGSWEPSGKASTISPGGWSAKKVN